MTAFRAGSIAPRTAPLRARSISVDRPKEGTLADNSGSVGVLGVLVGALIVLVFGGGLLLASGKLGNVGGGNTLKIELPKAK
jgi:hypothetical protein